MIEQYELVQQAPGLPFKYFAHDPLTDINVAPHWHQGIELNFLVAGGTLKFVTNGRTRDYEPGDIWAVNRRDVHSATGDPALDWQEFGFIIDDKFLTSRLTESVNWHLGLEGKQTGMVIPTAYSEIREHGLAMHHLLQHQLTDFTRLQVLSHFYALLVVLGENFATPVASADINPNPRLINAVMTTINQEFDRQLSGSELARIFHVSLTTLNQQFNANVQMPVNKYIRFVRLLNARRMLLESDNTLEYIASACGFSSDKTFVRNFKEWKHMTPSDYRHAFARYHRVDASCL
ncbi:AraC family transcriptional regulator [Lacticaseibacillus sharpeae]|nr:AraC family transcriptional regulator [Lacticaseibacillus sharpeae]